MEESQEIVLDVGAISSDEAYAVASESIAERLKAIDGKKKVFDNQCNWDSFKSASGISHPLICASFLQTLQSTPANVLHRRNQFSGNHSILWMRFLPPYLMQARISEEQHSTRFQAV
ncbi:unnamed protein product [Albugo candida]|uniref:Uncharacterized protein n=1 Tax=Albugo candida TaxID=65357 RepID=A0A024FYR2_9STRA|nr:unnamed protein product [Albugo candida]|eukprot:CCI11809.1 unnamed protein product [Albugo candida]